MKLLYITNQICGSAGLERVLSIKTDYLIEKYGYDIHILTMNQNNTPVFYDFNDTIRFHDITVKGNPIQYFLQYQKGLRSIVQKVQPDMISVCDDGLKGFFVPSIVGKPCPMIYERHVSKNIEVKEDKVSFKTQLITNIKYRLMHLGAKRYDRFVVLTTDNLSEWKLKNLQVISNPLSFNPDTKAVLEAKTVLAVGRQSYQKGYDRLLKSWKTIQDKYPDWKLKIYGKKDESLNLEGLANTLGIDSSVEFHSPTKEILNEYLNSSIYVMSSRFEGFGMVLIEAMACGVPAISFDCPCGPSDIITDNTDGFLVENNDISAFSEAIEKLILNPEKRKKMGANAKENIRRFLPEEIVPQWDTLFKSLAKNKI
ncbi:glycosyltransferase family 4 protein [uncultured Aquimarina sp.]|uniref:glycosyltransferase family 4 protein n=1 Tax=uncultured Aquimarina sp. TaxID=575652 RepID=UPI002608BBFC|nr:glycosyltransferase family 4 protein [uncultured Aquimarina sp.]